MSAHSLTLCVFRQFFCLFCNCLRFLSKKLRVYFSSSLFNFQGPAPLFALLCSAAWLIFYHTRLRLSIPFFIFFKLFLTPGFLGFSALTSQIFLPFLRPRLASSCSRPAFCVPASCAPAHFFCLSCLEISRVLGPSSLLPSSPLRYLFLRLFLRLLYITTSPLPLSTTFFMFYHITKNTILFL